MVSIGIMTMQINVRLPDNMLLAAKEYSQRHGYDNIQEFIKDTLRQKLYEDPDITGEELELVLKLAKVSEDKKLYKTEKDLFNRIRR